MKKVSSLFFLASMTLSVSNYANAAFFEPTFNVPTFPGSQFTVDAAHNDYYSVNFGITVENAYLYRDSRDTFDGVGIANGTVAGIGSPQSGKINFLDSTDFVSIDYLAILNASYQAFSSSGTLLSSFNVMPGTGTLLLEGGIISYLTFTSTGGYAAVSGLRYNYDGTTDGVNTDIPAVPEPSSVIMLCLGLLGVTAAARRRKQ